MIRVNQVVVDLPSCVLLCVLCVYLCAQRENVGYQFELINSEDASDKNHLKRSVCIVQGSRGGADAGMSADYLSREFCHVAQEEYTGQITSTPGSVREKESVLSRHTNTHRSVAYTHRKVSRYDADEVHKSG